jgi:hypothetical protein
MLTLAIAANDAARFDVLVRDITDRVRIEQDLRSSCASSARSRRRKSRN